MQGDYCAVHDGGLERVRGLISSYGPSYLQEWSIGYILLREAVENKHTEVAKLLLTNGSKVNSNNQIFDTPLHYAAINGDIEIVQMFIDRGANINTANRYGITPLHNAVKSEKIEIIELLLERGACVNRTGISSITPLHLALEGCNEEIIKLLLSRVTDFDGKGNDGRTYIHLQRREGIYKLLSTFYNMELMLILPIHLYIGKVIHHCALLLKKDMKKLFSCF
jgi:ankyrin repeat protein